MIGPIQVCSLFSLTQKGGHTQLKNCSPLEHTRKTDTQHVVVLVNLKTVATRHGLKTYSFVLLAVLRIHAQISCIYLIPYTMQVYPAIFMFGNLPVISSNSQ